VFRVKICGVTRGEDAIACAAAGADAIGLNFFAGSPRYVSGDAARQVADAVPWGVAKVGVFVNTPADQICATFDDLGLDWIQLHGDEPPEFLRDLVGRPVIRALRCGPQGLAPIAEYVARSQALGCAPQTLLLDAHAAGSYGGTGQMIDWSILKTEAWLRGIPLVLAGGLKPENVAQAIQLAQPRAVDTASGVESSPGIKDAERVKAFVAAAREAFGEIDQR